MESKVFYYNEFLISFRSYFRRPSSVEGPRGGWYETHPEVEELIFDFQLSRVDGRLGGLKSNIGRG